MKRYALVNHAASPFTADRGLLQQATYPGTVSTWERHSTTPPGHIGQVPIECVARLVMSLGAMQSARPTEAEALEALARQVKAVADAIAAMASRAREGTL